MSIHTTGGIFLGRSENDNALRGKNQRELSTTQIIAVGFLLAIFMGALLLCLPAASSDGQSKPFIDALFTATTSVCVTGLTVVDTTSAWSLFGHIIILLLIQIGGLGIVSITTSIMLLIGRRVTLKDRLLLEDAFNMNTLSGLVRFLRRVLKWTFITEGIGAVCYSFSLVPRFGWAKGLWTSVFMSVSAFCNAGIDILGGNSLNEYAGDVWINLVTCALVILGGLGFIVWFDIAKVINLIRRRELQANRFFRKLSLHTKLVMIVTAGLLLSGTVLVFCFEYNNPLTIGSMSFGEKVMASFFQSVTCRTAGFTTVPQDALRDPTSLVCMILFFIGGSPVGTAGGVKTTSMAMVVLYALSAARGNKDVNLFHRSIPQETLRKAIGVVTISFTMFLVSAVSLSAVSGGSLIDVMYETSSALGTVGLTRSFTPSLNMAGKLIVVACMYLGRIGPISMAIAFGRKRGTAGVVYYPNEDITVG